MKTRNPVLLILMLGSLSTISPFSIDMYLPSFKQIAEEFHSTAQHVALSLSAYFIGLAVGQIFYGPFLDRFGRRRPLFLGLGLYVIATLACVFSHSVESLVVCRILQAFGGCVGSVAATAMVRDFFPVSESAKVFAYLMLILSVSPLFAPTVGGFVASALGWRAVFYILMGIVSLLTLLLFVFLPEGHAPDPEVSLDIKSISKGFQEIFRHPKFFAYTMSGSFSFASLFIYLAGAPDLFLSTFKLSERTFGLVFAFLSIGMIGGGQVNILLMRRFTSEQIYLAAIRLQMATAAVFLAGALFNWYGLVAHIAILFVFISCVGLISPNSGALSLAPFEKNAGAAASLMGFLNMSIGAVASAGFSVLPFRSSSAIAFLFLITATIGYLFVRKAHIPRTNSQL